MAKLYWRVKKNDKWTWVPVSDSNTRVHPKKGTYVYIPRKFEGKATICPDVRPLPVAGPDGVGDKH